MEQAGQLTCFYNNLDIRNNRDSWSNRGDKKCSDSGYVLKMEQTGFTDMGVTCKKREKERGGEGLKIWGLKTRMIQLLLSKVEGTWKNRFGGGVERINGSSDT